MSQIMINLISHAFWQTCYMILVSTSLTAIGGIPLGMLLFITQKKGIWPQPKFNLLIGSVVNALRSIPFIILLVAIIPFTQFVVGTSIGTNAAIVPLVVGAIPFFARIVENALSEVPKGLIEAAQSMGASVWQILWKFLFPESLPAIINGLTVTTIAIVGYTAMAGTVGGGGLGDVAISYGYQRFNTTIMLSTVVILIVLVQVLQSTGDFFAKLYDKR
jgi:D-methionine transport system permease protein